MEAPAICWITVDLGPHAEAAVRIAEEKGMTLEELAAEAIGAYLRRHAQRRPPGSQALHLTDEEVDSWLSELEAGNEDSAARQGHR